MSIVKDGGWLSVMWELVVVIAAGMAVVTNMLVIASFNGYNKQLKEMQDELYHYEDELDAYKDYVEQLSSMYGELHAQVQWGLKEHYNIGE